MRCYMSNCIKIQYQSLSLNGLEILCVANQLAQGVPGLLHNITNIQSTYANRASNSRSLPLPA